MIRRAVLFGVLGVLLLGAVAVGGGVLLSGSARPPASADFTRALTVPPLAAAHREGTRVTFDLRLQAGSTDFGRGRPTATWGVNGSYLGPTLRAHRGDEVTVHVTNALGETTTMHWHGMHLPARADGGPHQPIAPGATWSPSWRIDQPAATLWYHPHPDGRTARHVYRGLAGLFLLDDDASDSLPLPHTYGVDDLPLIVQDKLFTSGGQLREQPAGISNVGLLGDTILVNGVPTPHRTVTTSKVRLRLLDASNARSYNFGFADDRGFDLLGTDGGLLPAPAPLNRIQLAPGERAEIVATLRPGERTVLRSYPPHLGAGFLADRFAGGEDTFDVLRLDAAATLSPSPELPTRLADPPTLPTGDGAPTRTFGLGDNEINGRSMDMDRTDFVAPAGAPETWEVDNRDGSPHTFHVHGTSFTVRDVDGRPPPAALSGWKDTVYVAPGTRLRLVLRLPDTPDPSWPYMYHCHMLRHEDAGMMGQFLVVAPGAAPAPHADTPRMPDMPGMAASPPPPLPAGTR